MYHVALDMVEFIGENIDDNGDPHQCYRIDYLDALEYIKTHGVPRKDLNFISFDCTIFPHIGAAIDLHRIYTV